MYRTNNKPVFFEVNGCIEDLLVNEVYPKIRYKHQNRGRIYKKDFIAEVARRFKLNKKIICKSIIPFFKEKKLIEEKGEFIFFIDNDKY